MTTATMVKDRLFTPGPTPVPAEVTLAMSRPIIHHRSEAFDTLFSRIKTGLQEVFRTGYDVIPLACSGTGAMEAAVVNTVSPGTKVLAVGGGKFAERWEELCAIYGAEVTPYPLTWGHSPDPAAIERLLDENPGISAVFATQCETSTGALADIEAIGRITGPRGILLVVDAITGTGVHPLFPEQWQVDMVVAGSQKGLMTPPGLGFVCVSPRAWDAIEKSEQPRYYFDLAPAREAYRKNQTAFTPATTLLTGLQEALARLCAEGMEQVWQRHARLAEAARNAVTALGLQILPEHPCNVLTPVVMPQGIDAADVSTLLRERFGMTVAGGQGQLKGKIIRISHTGFIDRFDVITVTSALEQTLKILGYDAADGTAAAAAIRNLTD